MKIGILTFSRTQNYGAILQCFALQETLLKEGHDVKVIEYKQPHIETYSSVFSWKYIWIQKYHLGNIYRYIKNYKIRGEKHKRFQEFKKKYLICTKPCNQKSIPQDFDVYLIGSDQLWTKVHTGGYFDKVFFGYFKKKKNAKILSYAISCNKKSIESLIQAPPFDISKNFQTLSFREENTSNIISSTFNIKTRVDIDPTLLASKDTWEKIANDSWSNQKYIAVYQARTINNFENSLIDKANELAKKLNLGVINLSTYDYSPSDFISIIKYAKCIFTTSFHGLAFSLIFNKPFYVFKLNDGHDGRSIELLTKLGADKNIVPIESQIYEISYLDYDKINHELNKLREHSMNYIKSI